jgi:hypothetical protein
LNLARFFNAGICGAMDFLVASATFEHRLLTHSTVADATQFFAAIISVP